MPKLNDWSVVGLIGLIAAIGIACSGSPDSPPVPPQTTTQAPAISVPPATGTVTGKIAFQSDRTGNPNIFVMNADGSGVSQLTSDDTEEANPAWSPDGSRIAYQSNRDFSGATSSIWFAPKSLEASDAADLHGGMDVYVITADGSGVKRLTTLNPEDEIDPAWSPDGSRIAFSSDRTDPEVTGLLSDIFVMNADGSNIKQITTESGGGNFEPTWSPDGSRIAFTSNRDGNLDIFAMDSNGKSPTNLTNNTTLDLQPVWSPNADRIAYASFAGGNFEVFVMDADGSNQTNLTNDASTDNDPAWSPDGSQIAFSSDRSGSLDIYVMNADGTNLRRVTTDTSSEFQPTWTR